MIPPKMPNSRAMPPRIPRTIHSASADRLIQEPVEAVSFVGPPLGSPFEEAFDLVPHGLEVAQAGPQRPLQLGQGVEQPVMGRPPPQLLPEPLDRVQLRAIAG